MGSCSGRRGGGLRPADHSTGHRQSGGGAPGTSARPVATHRPRARHPGTVRPTRAVAGSARGQSDRLPCCGPLRPVPGYPGGAADPDSPLPPRPHGTSAPRKRWSVLARPREPVHPNGRGGRGRGRRGKTRCGNARWPTSRPGPRNGRRSAQAGSNPSCRRRRASRHWLRTRGSASPADHARDAGGREPERTSRRVDGRTCSPEDRPVFQERASGLDR